MLYQLFNFYSRNQLQIIVQYGCSQCLTLSLGNGGGIIWQMGPPVAVSLDEVLYRVILWRGLLIMSCWIDSFYQAFRVSLSITLSLSLYCIYCSVLSFPILAYSLWKIITLTHFISPFKRHFSNKQYCKQTVNKS